MEREWHGGRGEHGLYCKGAFMLMEAATRTMRTARLKFICGLLWAGFQRVAAP